MKNQYVINGMPKILVVLVILAMAGCAPDLGPLTQPRADLTAGPSESNKSDTTNYPSANWWEVYGDPQLNDLITEGLKNSPSITEAAARVRKANAVAQEQGAALGPTLSADGTIEKYRQSYNEGVPAEFVPHGFNNLASAQLNFNYEIDFWGKNHDTLAAALSEARAVQLDAEQAKIMLSTNIAAAYADLFMQYAELDATKDSLNVEDKTLSLFKDRYSVGLENQGAIAQEEAKKAGIEIQIATLNEQIALTKNRLAALIGAKPDRAETIERPAVSNFNTLGLPAIIPADLIARRPDLRAASERMVAAAHQINVAHAGYYPNINLAANIGHQSLGLGPFFKNSSLTGAFGPAIDLPIFEGGALEGAYRGARADYDNSVAQFEGAMIEALHEVADAETSEQALTVRDEKTKDAVKAAQFAYNITNNRYKGGLDTYLNVLNAENALILARFAEADINARAFTLDIQMVKALGGGYAPNTNSNDTKETTP